LFFLAGVTLSFVAVVPATLRFFLGFSSAELQPLISIDRYLDFVLWMAFGFGCAFQMPVLLIGASRAGILRAETLARMRPYAVVGIFIFAALVTPTPDPLTQCLFAFPLWGLFEGSLLIMKFVQRAKR